MVVFPVSSVQGDSACADVTIIDDNALECEQDFMVFISSATLGTDISRQPEAFVFIVDNDGKEGMKIARPLLLCSFLHM